MKSMLLTQQKQDEYIKPLDFKVNMLSTHNEMLEAQITQQASSSSTPPGRLPCKPEPNPRDQCNAMVFQGDKQLKGPKGVSNDEHFHDVNNESLENELPIPSKDVISNDTNESNEPPKDPK